MTCPAFINNIRKLQFDVQDARKYNMELQKSDTVHKTHQINE